MGVGRATVQDRPYQCEQCPAAFSRRPYLEIHMRTHTGERPFTCDICLKRFTQKSSLNIHKTLHDGQFNYNFVNFFFTSVHLFESNRIQIRKTKRKRQANKQSLKCIIPNLNVFTQFSLYAPVLLFFTFVLTLGFGIYS